MLSPCCEQQEGRIRLSGSFTTPNMLPTTAQGANDAGLDFGKLTKRSVVESATEPRHNFAALPTRDPKYARPWDVQTQAWDRWHKRRTIGNPELQTPTRRPHQRVPSCRLDCSDEF